MPKHIIISRTDNIGDVVLCLPVAGVLKKQFSDCKITFIGNAYTRDIVEACEHVDKFIDVQQILDSENLYAIEMLKQQQADVIVHVFPNKKLAHLFKMAKIPMRIATTNRLYHWCNCNKLVRLSRKKSFFHEAQLNIKLLAPLGIKKLFELNDIPNYYGLTKIKLLSEELKILLSKDKFNLILHPKLKSGREWGINNFSKMISMLPEEKFKIFITGTKKEGAMLCELFQQHSCIIDMTGRLSLSELISFIANVDGMIAASTGPLHLAAALNKYVVGIYSHIRPIFPTRWAPLGKNAAYIIPNNECCKKNKNCDCIQSIRPEAVKQKLIEMINL